MKSIAYLWKLRNHRWTSVVSPKQEKKPGFVVRKIGKAFLVRDRDWSSRHTYSDFSSEHFNSKSNPRDLAIEATAMLQILCRQANAGDDSAAVELARLAIFATQRLNRIALKKPSLFVNASTPRIDWPVLRSKRSRLTEFEKDLFAAIHLGHDCVVESHAATAKWIVDDASEIAFGLLSYIQRLRAGESPLTGKLVECVQELDSFDDESAPQWWEVAKDFLLFTYPEPEQIAELKSLVRAESKQRPPSRLRCAIVGVIKDRFLSFPKPAKRYRT